MKVNNHYQARVLASQMEYRFAKIEKLIPVYMKTGLQVYPHQVTAALAAIANPYIKGFILCDETGLGKGVEALMVISHTFHSGNERIVIVVPSPLLDQWQDALTRFDLPFMVWDKDTELTEESIKEKVVLTTYYFANQNWEKLKNIAWDLSVLEEAHCLRNRESQTHQNLHSAFENVRKLLVTGTPMQKNVMCLFGLMNFIEKDIFGDADEFYQRYYRQPQNYDELKELLAPYTFRTLRSQVKADVLLPERNILTQQYRLSPQELELNDLLTKYITKPDKLAFPKMDNYELNLMFQKIFASSIYALSKTLSGVYLRLAEMSGDKAKAEADEVKKMLDLAVSLTDTTKGKTFLLTLHQAFTSLSAKNQPNKIIVFTDNTQTQEYLAKLIAKNTKYKAVVYNGTTGRDVLDKFRKKVQILITTDLGAEGFDWQFSNFVINYDNSFNILMLEQRIGRVHRIGQKNDVSVINFLCPDIFADVRFYQLVYKRLAMFGDILGASDGVVADLSKANINVAIASLVASGRSESEVSDDFAYLQEEFADDVAQNKELANKFLFNTFDESLVKKTRNYAELIRQKTAEMKDKMWAFTKFVLGSYATFDEEKRSFFINKSLYKSRNIYNMRYTLDWDDDTPKHERFHPNCKDYNQTHTINYDFLINNIGKLTLDGTGTKLKGKSGFLAYYSVSGSGNGKYVWVGQDENGNPLTEDECKRIMELPCTYHTTIDFRSLNEHDDKHVAELLELRKPELDKYFRENASETIKAETKRIRALAENKKRLLRFEIEALERELAKAKREGTGSSFHEDFIHSQKVAELAKKLDVKKENEFFAKLDLNKQADAQIAKLTEKVSVYSYKSRVFMVYFSVT